MCDFVIMYFIEIGLFAFVNFKVVICNLCVGDLVMFYQMYCFV